MIYIYKLIDPRNNEVRYVGKTINIKRRYKQHLYDKRASHKSSWVQSLRTHKLKPVLEILEICNDNNWKEREVYWIGQFNNLTNLKEGGGSDYIRTTSAETKQKIRLKHTGRKLSQNWKDNIKQSTKNKRKIVIDNIIYDSIMDAANSLNLVHSTVYRRVISKTDNFKNYQYLL
jgi:group I intron endonuclease